MKKLLSILIMFPFFIQAQQAEQPSVTPTFDFAQASKSIQYTTPIFFEPIERNEQAFEGMKIGAIFLSIGLAAITASFIMDKQQMNRDIYRISKGNRAATLRVSGAALATLSTVGISISLANLQSKSTLKTDVKKTKVKGKN